MVALEMEGPGPRTPTNREQTLRKALEVLEAEIRGLDGEESSRPLAPDSPLIVHMKLRKWFELGSGNIHRLKRRRPTPRKQVTPAFKMIFFAVLTLTILAGIAQIALAGIWPTPTSNQQSAFEAFGFAWKAGIGAIFGLLGGKAT